MKTSAIRNDDEVSESDKQSTDNEKKRSTWTQDTSQWDLGSTLNAGRKWPQTKQDSNVDGQ
jgi:hypothetical protein